MYCKLFTIACKALKPDFEVSKKQCNFAVKNQRKMSKTFVLHDESVNTYGFRMLTSGANLDEFRKNPVM